MNITWTQEQDTDGQSVLEFKLTTAGDRLVTGALWLPNESNRPADAHERARATECLVCLGHGASGDRYQFPIASMANRLRAEGGIASLSLDGPVHGLRSSGEGHPRDRFMQAFVEGTIIDSMAEDWQVALDAVAVQTGNRASRIGYFGLSMGTMLGLETISRMQELRVAVLGLAGASDQMPHSGRLKSAAAQIDVPTLFLMNLEDEFFSRDMYLDLFDAIGASDKRIHANPGAHDHMAEDEVAFTCEFLRQHLQQDDKRCIRSIVDGTVL